MIKRIKVSVIILNEIRRQVCSCVKDTERAGESKPKYLYFVSSLRISGREEAVGFLSPGCRKGRLGAVACAGVFVAGRYLPS